MECSGNLRLRVNRFLVSKFDFDDARSKGELPNLDSELDWKFREDGALKKWSHDACIDLLLNELDC